MLSPQEKNWLKNPDTLKPNRRAKLYFNVAKKIKNQLEELKEVNEALLSIPQKNAMRIVNDDMIAYSCGLIENILNIMGSSPIGIDEFGVPYTVRITRSGPGEFKLMTEKATKEDVAKQFLLEDHIKKVRQFVDLDVGIKITDKRLRPLRYKDKISITIDDGANLYEKWNRSGPRPQDWEYKREFL